jgi:sulfate transport system ATP-binding protein
VSIQFDQISKRYRGVAVVSDVTIEIATGEFFVLLGPSGSGKSTLLRAVAGLTSIDNGRISLHGRDVTHVEARHRGVGFVFQHYALFRNMSVADNIEFALRVRRMRGSQRRERRRELLKLVDLEGMDDRIPAQLSGGQQQRVAVARALAHEPAVLLLDEPFGALDAKIRVELRRTIRDVQRRLGTTAILVTHDQEEAFALGDRIGVMHNGRLLETGRPAQLYRHPATRFVAKFLGAANILLGRRNADGVTLDATRGDGEDALVVVRPEDLELAVQRQALAHPWLADGTVLETSFGGGIERLRVVLPPESGVRSAQALEGTSEEQPPTLEITRTGADGLQFPVAPGQSVAVGLRRLHVLPTPISGFVVHAHTREASERLRAAAILSHLVRSMQAPVREGDWPDPAGAANARKHASGVAVVATSATASADIVRLVAAGSTRILCLSPDTPLPRRALIAWLGERVRASTLALAASLIRHMPVEATLLGLPESGASTTERGGAFRRMLNARAEFRASHGLDVSTEMHIGNLASRLLGPVGQLEPTMLILGIEGTVEDLQGTLSEQLDGLLSVPNASPIFIVHHTVQRSVVSSFREREVHS